MSLSITLKKCISPPNKVGKEFSGDTESFEVVFKENTDLFKPTFIIQSNYEIWKYNYIDASDSLGRKYFITDVRSIGNERYEIDCKTDVLETWNGEIRSLTAIINKQEGVSPSNKYLNDGSFISQVNEFNTSYNFPNGFNDSGVFILICAGG